MKITKRSILALLIGILMLVSLVPMTVSAASGSANTVSYVAEAVKPTVDGFATEKAWDSTNTVDGVTILWSDKGLFFKTGLNVTFEYADTVSDAKTKVTVANGVVTGLPKGSEYAAGTDTVEIFVPYTHKFEYKWHGFKQYRTQGPQGTTHERTTLEYAGVDADGNPTSGTVTIKTALETGVRVFDFITEASDLIGNVMQLNTKKLEFAGAYGYTDIIGGEPPYYNYDRDPLTGQSKYNTYVASAEKPVIEGLTSWDDANGNTYVITDYDPNGNPIPRYGFIAPQLAYAAQVTDATAPLIDGSIDAVWETTARIYGLNETDEPGFDAWGYVSFLWSTEGLYYLAVIEDPSTTTELNENVDRTFFAVSETSVAGNEVEPYTTFPTTIDMMNDVGSYAFGMSPLGTVVLGACSGAAKEAAGLGLIHCASSITKTGYVIEAYVPYFKLTAAEAKPGHEISISCTIENYLPGVSGRDEYTNLFDMSGTTGNPSRSFPVVFVGEYDVGEETVSMKDVYDMVQGLLNQYQKAEDALTTAIVDGRVMSYTDPIEDALAAIEEKISALENASSGYATKAEIDALKAELDSVKSSFAPYATKAELNEGLDGIEIKDYTAVVVILFVVAAIEAAGIVFCFLKKK